MALRPMIIESYDTRGLNLPIEFSDVATAQAPPQLFPHKHRKRRGQHDRQPVIYRHTQRANPSKRGMKRLAAKQHHHGPPFQPTQAFTAPNSHRTTVHETPLNLPRPHDPGPSIHSVQMYKTNNALKLTPNDMRPAPMPSNQPRRQQPRRKYSVPQEEEEEEDSQDYCSDGNLEDRTQLLEDSAEEVLLELDRQHAQWKKDWDSQIIGKALSRRREMDAHRDQKKQEENFATKFNETSRQSSQLDLLQQQHRYLIVLEELRERTKHENEFKAETIEVLDTLQQRLQQEAEHNETSLHRYVLNEVHDVNTRFLTVEIEAEEFEYRQALSVYELEMKSKLYKHIDELVFLLTQKDHVQTVEQQTRDCIILEHERTLQPIIKQQCLILHEEELRLCIIDDEDETREYIEIYFDQQQRLVWVLWEDQIHQIETEEKLQRAKMIDTELWERDVLFYLAFEIQAQQSEMRTLLILKEQQEWLDILDIGEATRRYEDKIQRLDALVLHPVSHNLLGNRPPISMFDLALNHVDNGNTPPYQYSQPQPQRQRQQRHPPQQQQTQHHPAHPQQHQPQHYEPQHHQPQHQPQHYESQHHQSQHQPQHYQPQQKTHAQLPPYLPKSALKNNVNTSGIADASKGTVPQSYPTLGYEQWQSPNYLPDDPNAHSKQLWHSTTGGYPVTPNTMQYINNGGGMHFNPFSNTMYNGNINTVSTKTATATNSAPHTPATVQKAVGPHYQQPPLPHQQTQFNHFGHPEQIPFVYGA